MTRVAPWTRALGLSALALALFLPATSVVADDAEAQQSQPAESAAAPAANAAVINWNPVTRQMEEPTAAARAKMMEELEKSLVARFGSGLDEKGQVVIEKLPSGAVKARVPFSHFNASIIKVGADGELVGSCVDGLPEAVEAASREVTANAGEQE